MRVLDKFKVKPSKSEKNQEGGHSSRVVIKKKDDKFSIITKLDNKEVIKGYVKMVPLKNIYHPQKIKR